MLLLGPRNTVDQNLNLLQRAGCVRLVYGQEMARQAQHLRTKHVDLSIHELPPHHELVAQATIPYPFIKTFSSAWNDPVLMLHSSGTTGTLEMTDKDDQTLITYRKP